MAKLDIQPALDIRPVEEPEVGSVPYGQRSTPTVMDIKTEVERFKKALDMADLHEVSVESADVATETFLNTSEKLDVGPYLPGAGRVDMWKRLGKTRDEPIPVNPVEILKQIPKGAARFVQRDAFGFFGGTAYNWIGQFISEGGYAVEQFAAWGEKDKSRLHNPLAQAIISTGENISQHGREARAYFMHQAMTGWEAMDEDLRKRDPISYGAGRLTEGVASSALSVLAMYLSGGAAAGEVLNKAHQINRGLLLLSAMSAGGSFEHAQDQDENFYWSTVHGLADGAIEYYLESTFLEGVGKGSGPLTAGAKEGLEEFFTGLIQNTRANTLENIKKGMSAHEASSKAIRDALKQSPWEVAAGFIGGYGIAGGSNMIDLYTRSRQAGESVGTDLVDDLNKNIQEVGKIEGVSKELVSDLNKSLEEVRQQATGEEIVGEGAKLPPKVQKAHEAIEKLREDIPVLREGATQADIKAVEAEVAGREQNMREAISVVEKAQADEIKKAEKEMKQLEAEEQHLAGEQEAIAEARQILDNLKEEVAQLQESVPVMKEGYLQTNPDALDAFINERTESLQAAKEAIEAIESKMEGMALDAMPAERIGFSRSQAMLGRIKTHIDNAIRASIPPAPKEKAQQQGVEGELPIPIREDKVAKAKGKIARQDKAIEARLDALMEGEGKFLEDLGFGGTSEELQADYSITPGSKLKQYATVKTNMEDADFWLQRKGSKDTVGRPTREFSKENIGIKVTATDDIDPRYLFYVFQNIYNQGVWKKLAHGTLKLQNIKASDVASITMGGRPDFSITARKRGNLKAQIAERHADHPEVLDMVKKIDALSTISKEELRKKSQSYDRFINALASRLRKELPEIRVDEALGDIQNDAYLLAMEQLASKGSPGSIQRVSEYAKETDDLTEAAFIFTPKGPGYKAMRQYIKKEHLQGIKAPRYDKRHKAAAEELEKLRAAQRIMKPWPTFTTEEGLDIPLESVGEVKGLAETLPAMVGGKRLRRSLTGAKRGPIMFDVIEELTVQSLTGKKSNLNKRDLNLFNRAIEEANTKRIDVFSHLYNKYPQWRERIGIAWEGARRKVHFEAGEQSKLKSWPSWKEEVDRLITFGKEKPQINVVGNVPESDIQDVSEMNSSPFHSRRTELVYNDSVYSPTESEVSDSLGVTLYGKAKDKNFSFTASERVYPHEGRFRIETFADGFDRVGTLSHAKGHIGLRYVREASPKLFEQVKKWYAKQIKSGHTDRPMKELFARSYAYEDQGIVKSSLPRGVIKAIKDMEQNDIPNDIYNNMIKNWNNEDFSIKGTPDPLNQIHTALRDAIKLRPKTVRQQKEALRQRVGAAAAIKKKNITKGMPIDIATYKSAGMLKGLQADYEQVYESIRDKLSHEVKQAAFEKIDSIKELRYFENLNTHQAFGKLLDGTALTPGEVGMIERVFGKTFADVTENRETVSGLYDKIVTLWKAGLLTGIKTSGLNTVANASHSMTETAKDIPAAFVDSIASLFTKERTVAFTARGLPGGVKEGVEKGWKYMKTGVDTRNVGEKLDYNRVNFGKGKVARGLQAYEEFVFHLLGSEDQPFYYGAKARSLYSQAIAQAKTKGLKGDIRKDFIRDRAENPTDEMLEWAVHDAEVAVFQNRTAAGDIAKAIQKPTHTDKMTGKKITVKGMEFIIPFGRTPAAVATQVVHYSPIGAIHEVAKQIQAGEFNQRTFSHAFGRSAVGTGALYIGGLLFKAGLMTLDYPDNEKERKLWELEGRKANSVKIGGKWRDVQALGPVGNVLVIGGHFQQALNSSGSPTEAMVEAMAGGAKSFTEQTFVRGLNMTIDAITDPERSFDRWFTSMAGSAVPTIVADIARAGDTVERRTAGPKERIFSRLPFGPRKSLEPKINVFGQDLPRYGGNILETMADPTRPSIIRTDVVVTELRRLWDNGVKVSPPQLGSKKGYEILTKEENTQLWRRAGELTYKFLVPLAKGSKGGDKKADFAKGKAIEKMITKAQDVAKLEMVKILQGRKVPQKDIIDSGLLNVENKTLIQEFGIDITEGEGKVVGEPVSEPFAEEKPKSKKKIVSKL